MSEAYATIIVAGCGMIVTWGAWVTVMIFEHKAKIALLKQEIEVLQKMEILLESIDKKLAHYDPSLRQTSGGF